MRSSSRPTAAKSRSRSAPTARRASRYATRGSDSRRRRRRGSSSASTEPRTRSSGRCRGRGSGCSSRMRSPTRTAARSPPIPATAAAPSSASSYRWRNERRLAGAHQRAEAPALPAPAAGMSSVVLVADDDDDILLLVTTRLKRDGFDVVAARDGFEALALAHEHKPAVAVLDVGMPGLDGLEVLERIRETQALAHTRVLLLT